MDVLKYKLNKNGVSKRYEELPYDSITPYKYYWKKIQDIGDIVEWVTLEDKPKPTNSLGDGLLVRNEDTSALIIYEYNDEYYYITENVLEIKFEESHKLRSNDSVIFLSEIQEIYFKEIIDIDIIDDKTIIIDDFLNKKYQLYPQEIIVSENTNEGEDVDGEIENDEGETVIRFREPHDFVKARDIYPIKWFTEIDNFNHLGGVEYTINEKHPKLCEGDYILVNQRFLHKIKVIVEDKITLYRCENITDATLYINNKVYENFIVPVLPNGKDDQYTLIYSEKIDEDLIRSAWERKDTSRFPFSEDVVSLNRESGHFKLEIPLGQVFQTNLFQEDLVNKDFIDIEINKAINPIVDMEKIMFEPYCKDGDNFYPIKEINFNFNFRDRTSSGKQNEGWNIDESEGPKYWNTYKLKSEVELERNRGGKNEDFSQSDLLGFLNFTDNDVKYQKNRLKKSFIRLLFYDSRNIAKQNLLFYATVFYNTGSLFGKYSNNLPIDDKVKNDQYTAVVEGYSNDEISVNCEYSKSNETVDESKRLSSQIVIKDKYNSDASSEGFYLYLFKETYDQYLPTTVYMKVEFNHAGYGKTVPLVYPVIESEGGSKPIDPTDKTFPTTYLDETEMEVDMKRLYRDMFIEIKTKYDEKLGKYIWYMPRDMDKYNGGEEYSTGKLIFNLFEPKIN